MNSEFNIEVRCIKDLWPSNHKKPSYEFEKWLYKHPIKGLYDDNIGVLESDFKYNQQIINLYSEYLQEYRHKKLTELFK